MSPTMEQVQAFAASLVNEHRKYKNDSQTQATRQALSSPAAAFRYLLDDPMAEVHQYEGSIDRFCYVYEVRKKLYVDGPTTLLNTHRRAEQQQVLANLRVLYEQATALRARSSRVTH